MTYMEMLKQRRSDNDSLRYTPRIGIELTKMLTKTNSSPYRLKDSTSGPKTVVQLDKHFIKALQIADSTDDMSTMSKAEKKVYWDYIKYQSIMFDTMASNLDLTSEEVVEKAKSIYESKRSYNVPEIVVRAIGDWMYANLFGGQD